MSALRAAVPSFRIERDTLTIRLVQLAGLIVFLVAWQLAEGRALMRRRAAAAQPRSAASSEPR